MIFDKNTAASLIEQLKLANEHEGVAILALQAEMQKEIKDQNTIMLLTEKMSESHNKKMALWSELEKLRIDN